MVEIILASASPRRRELMSALGLPFRIVSADVEEKQRPGEGAEELVRRLSREKAWAVGRQMVRGVVVAADTIVVLDGRVLGKPADTEEARAMLRALRGAWHEVMSAVTVLRQPNGRAMTECATTKVQMRHYSDEEIEAYIASGDPMDKAGAYAIQHAGFHPVERIDGCYATVVGLPLCHLYRALHRIGITETRIPVRGCTSTLERACTFYPRLLPGPAANE